MYLRKSILKSLSLANYLSVPFPKAFATVTANINNSHKMSMASKKNTSTTSSMSNDAPDAMTTTAKKSRVTGMDSTDWNLANPFTGMTNTKWNMMTNPFENSQMTMPNSMDPMTGWMTTMPYNREMNQDMNRDIRREQRALAPLTCADLIEKEKEYSIFVDCPGVEDLTVAVSDGLLEITGNRKRCFEEDTDTMHQAERSFGQVRRRLTIPKTASAEAATATYRNGVLEVHFPKIEDTTTTRRILPLEVA